MPIPDFRLPDIGEREIVTWARLRLAQGETTVVQSRLERFLAAMAEQGRHGSALVLRVLLAPRRPLLVLVPAAPLVQAPASLAAVSHRNWTSNRTSESRRKKHAR